MHYLSSEIQTNECCVITLCFCGVRFKMKPGMNINQPVSTKQFRSDSEIILM